MRISYKHPLCGTRVRATRSDPPIPEGAAGVIHGVGITEGEEHRYLDAPQYFYIIWDKEYERLDAGGWDSRRFDILEGTEAIDALPLAST